MWGTSTTLICRTWKRPLCSWTSSTAAWTPSRPSCWVTWETSGCRPRSRPLTHRSKAWNESPSRRKEENDMDANSFWCGDWGALCRYTVEWIGREGLDIETHEEYLNHFISHFYKNVVKLVDRAMRKEDSSAQGQIVTEILQHLHACNNSVKIFYGREESCERIKRYMLGDSDKPLVLFGDGGCGKTSLLSKSVSLVATEWFAHVRPINVIRFLGTTPDSSALTATLISICQQVKSIQYQLASKLDTNPSNLLLRNTHTHTPLIQLDLLQLHATLREHTRWSCSLNSTL